MGTPQDWAPYSSVEEAAKVYLRDPDLALDQLRSVVDLPTIKSFIMSRGSSDEPWGDFSGELARMRTAAGDGSLGQSMLRDNFTALYDKS